MKDSEKSKDELLKKELEQIEQRKIELEEELKKLELEKEAKIVTHDLESLEEKDTAVVSQEEKPELEIEKAEELKKQKEYDEKKSQRSRKYLIIGSILFVVLCVFLVFWDTKYYNDLEMVINPEDYYMLTVEDIHAMYGDPDPNTFGDKRNTVDMGDYSLMFSYRHGYVYFVSYMPKEPFKYKNGYTDVFYLFGLENEIGKFKPYPGEPEKFDRNDGYYIESIITDPNEKEKEMNDVTIFFKENYSEREVFEGDFSDVPVIYDLTGYLGKTPDEIVALLGESTEKPYPNLWVYNLKYGELVINFSKKGGAGVWAVDIYTNEPIKYENSTQEAMVMFGVDPELEGMYLDDYDYDLGYEEYKNYEGKNSIVRIDGIDKENKTFNEFNISILLD